MGLLRVRIEPQSKVHPPSEPGRNGERFAPLPHGTPAQSDTRPTWFYAAKRAPLRETDAPILRAYWLAKDIKAAVAAVGKAAGQVAMEPAEIPGYGTFAIYGQGGVDHGFRERWGGR